LSLPPKTPYAFDLHQIAPRVHPPDSILYYWALAKNQLKNKDGCSGRD